MKTNGIAFAAIMSVIIIAWVSVFVIMKPKPAPYSWKRSSIASQAIGCLLFAPDGTAYIGTLDNDMVYRSTDGCASWSLSNNGMEASCVNKLAVDSKGTVYAATAKGLYYSKDRGDNWELTQGQPNFAPALSVAVDYKDRVYVITSESRIMRSTDGGANWKSLIYFGPRDCITSLAFNPQGHIYLACYENIYLSQDDGLHCRQICSAKDTDANIRAIAVDSGNRVCAATNSGLLRYDGKHWELIRFFVKFKRNDYSCADVQIGPNNEFCATSGRGVFASRNHAKNWTYIGPARTIRFDSKSDALQEHTKIALDANGNILSAGNFGIYHGTPNRVK